MSKIIIDHNIISEPIMMMQTLLREVEILGKEKDMSPIDMENLKGDILAAPSVDDISEILKENFGNEIVIINKEIYGNNTQA